MDNGVDIAEDKIINANTTLSRTPSSREEGMMKVLTIVELKLPMLKSTTPALLYRQRQHHHQGNKNKRVKLRAIRIPTFIRASPKLTS